MCSSKEVGKFRAEYSEPLWTNSMFSGMPAYLISVLSVRTLFEIFSISCCCILRHPAWIDFHVHVRITGAAASPLKAVTSF